MSEFVSELTDSAAPIRSNEITYLNSDSDSDSSLKSGREHHTPLDVPVTVVMPTYNAGEYLKEAVESVLNQSYTKWRLIIIDDASTDKSLDTVYGYIDDPRIQLIQNSKNIGQTKCLNIALGEVSTPFMVQLDSDDWFYPYTLDTLMKETANIDSDTALISGNIRLVWQDQSGRIVRSKTRYGKNFSDPYDFMRAAQSCWPRCYRTDAVRTVGGWPVDGPYNGRYIEDLRILYRLIPKYRFHWVNQTLYIHRRHQHNMTRQVRKMRRTLYWLISDTLKKWGDRYTPKYKLTKAGYPKLITLVPKYKYNTSRKTKHTSAGKGGQQNHLNKTMERSQRIHNNPATSFVLTPARSVKGLSRRTGQAPLRKSVTNSARQTLKHSSRKSRDINKFSQFNKKSRGGWT